MGCTGGESFMPPFRTVRSKREQDDTIGDKQDREDYEADRTTIGKYQNEKYVSVSTGKLQ